MLKLILSIAGGLILLLLAIFGGMYAFDAPIGATVVDKNCGANEVTVKTDFGVTTVVPDIPTQQCVAIQNDNYLKYYLRSERTSIWESKGGACVYDTVHGVGGCDN